MKEVVSKISQETVERIMKSGGKPIKHGRYVYRAVGNEIHRCNSGSIGKTWIDAKGNKCDGWKLVVRA